MALPPRVVHRLGSSVGVLLAMLGAPVQTADELTATRLHAIEVVLESGALVVTFGGDGTFAPASIHEAEQWPPRLVIDLPDVRAQVPSTTDVDLNPLHRIRVVPHGEEATATRIVFDLTGPARYQIEGLHARGEPLRVIFPLSDLERDPVDRLGANFPDDPVPGSGARWRPVRTGAAPWAVAVPALGYADRGRSTLAPLEIAPILRPRSETTNDPGTEPDSGTADEQPDGGRWLRDQAQLVHRVDPVGVHLAPEPAPRRYDDVALAYGVPTLGGLLDPESAPVGDPIVVAFAAARDRRLPVARRQSRLIVPTRSTAPPQGQFQQAGGGGQVFTGDPISMAFQNADLRAVLRTFAEISGLNIVIDPQVDGVVDVSLTDVPWDQALDVILRANQLGYAVDGTIVRIAPVELLAEEEGQRRRLAEERALAGDLVVLTRTLSYARAESMAGLVTPLLSARGSVQIDERTNTMIITDLQTRLGTADELLDTLDRAEPQVEIEARIVQAGKDFARAIGVQWGITGRVAPDLGNTTPLTFPNRGGISGRVGAQGPSESEGDPRALDTEDVGSAVNLPASAATSAIGLSLGSVDGALNLDIVLSAAENDGQVKLLSHPRVTTQNNVEAEIVQGEQIPIQVVANNTVTVTFQDAALSLRVTPQITAADTVIMQIEIQNDFADFGREIQGIPPIVTQRASTTVQVADGNTTVIGGIFEREQSSSDSRVPVLHKIPLLGWLFKSRSERESTDELLIFLTPRVVR